MKKFYLLFFVVSLYTSASSQIGLPDPSFGNNGYISSAPPANVNFSFQTAIACLIDSQGSISLVIQSSNKTLISKRLPSGIPDLSYGRNCYSMAVSMIVTCAAVQPDGKIVVAGTPNGNDDFMLARYLTNGGLDSSFGTAGIVICDNGSKVEFLNTVAITNDGKILAGGMMLINDVERFTLVRFSSGGQLDQSFGHNGRVNTDFGQHSSLNKILVQPDQKIIAAGSVSSPTGSDFALARYNADGTPDTEFGAGGTTTQDFGFTDAANAIAIDATGKMYIGGNSNDSSGDRHFRIARFNKNGSPDYSFNLGFGSVMPVFGKTNDALTNISLQNNGSIIASGHSSLSTGDFAIQITRVTAEGTIDRNFGNNGLLIGGTDKTYDDSRYLVILPDGKILTGGVSRDNEPPLKSRFTCLRFHANGTPDLAFGDAGTLLDFHPTASYAYQALYVHGDGSLTAAGQLNDGNSATLSLRRFNSDGSPDKSYGQEGISALPNESNGPLYFQPDGKLLQVAYSPGNDGDIMLLRYNLDGSPDDAFGSAGKVVTDLGGSEAGSAVAFQGDGKIIVGASLRDPTGTDWLIIRYHPNGSIDSSFGSGGFVRKNTMKEENIESISIAPDGKIVVGGRGYIYPPEPSFTRFSILLSRLNPDGTFDQGFGDQGIRIINRSTFNYLGSFGVQNDGKLVFLYGSSNGATSEDFLERLNVNGTGDGNFGLNGKVAVHGTRMTLQSGQKILVSGTYRNNQNNEEFSISRFSRDGKTDFSFGEGGRSIVSFVPLNNNLYVNLMGGSSFYAAGSGVDKWGGMMGIISKFFVNTIQFCPPFASTVIVSDKSGTNYRWQVDTGSGFADLSDNMNYSGVTTKTLQLINAPSSWNGNIYRCTVDGKNSSYSEISFADTWTGSTSNAWENTMNWSCGAIPDANTDVIIEHGNVEINANTTIRSLQLNGGAKITVKTGVIFTILHK